MKNRGGRTDEGTNRKWLFVGVKSKDGANRNEDTIDGSLNNGRVVTLFSALHYCKLFDVFHGVCLVSSFILCKCFACFTFFPFIPSHSHSLPCRSSPSPSGSSPPSSLSSSSSSPSFPLNCCLRAVRLWYLLRSFCLFLMGVYHHESSVRSNEESHCCQQVELPATGMLRLLWRYS